MCVYNSAKYKRNMSSVDKSKAKPLKKREKLSKLSANGETGKQKNSQPASVKVEDVDIKTLSIDDGSSTMTERLSSSAASTRSQRSEKLTVKEASGDSTAPRSPVMRSRSLPVDDTSLSTAENRKVSTRQYSVDSADLDDDAENDPDWPFAGKSAKTWHPYRRYSLPVTPVCPRGTEIFPVPRRNSLATTTLRTISQHYELFHTQEKILEEQGEECGDLASPQGMATFQLPNRRSRKDETASSLI